MHQVEPVFADISRFFFFEKIVTDMEPGAIGRPDDGYLLHLRQFGPYCIGQGKGRSGPFPVDRFDGGRYPVYAVGPGMIGVEAGLVLNP